MLRDLSTCEDHMDEINILSNDISISLYYELFSFKPSTWIVSIWQRVSPIWMGFWVPLSGHRNGARSLPCWAYNGGSHKFHQFHCQAPHIGVQIIDKGSLAIVLSSLCPFFIIKPSRVIEISILKCWLSGNNGYNPVGPDTFYCLWLWAPRLFPSI